MFIKVEETPNPDTLKFIPEKDLGLSNNFFLNKGDDIKSFPIAKELFEIEGVKSILLDNDFISVTKSSNESWEFLKTIITSQLGSYFQESKPIMITNSKAGNDKKEFSQVEIKIRDLLETRVKPVVAGHGGDISFHSFEEGTVYLELKGSCSGCPSSTATLKMGIENMLKHYIPEIKEVLEVGN